MSDAGDFSDSGDMHGAAGAAGAGAGAARGARHADADDEFAFASYAEDRDARQPTKQSTLVANQHFDEAVSVSDADESVFTPPISPSRGGAAPTVANPARLAAANSGRQSAAASRPAPGTRNGLGDTPPSYPEADEHDDDEHDEDEDKSELPHEPPAPRAASAHRVASRQQQDQPRASPTAQYNANMTKAIEAANAQSATDASVDESEQVNSKQEALPDVPRYDAGEYKDLAVSPEVQALFDHIDRYTPLNIPLDTILHPFIPDYIPCIGEADTFIKVPRPDDKKDELGLAVMDEPAAVQSDPTVLGLRLRALSKQSNLQPLTIHSIENADKNPQKITSWINNIQDVHKQKPPPTVHYAKPMPSIDSLMQMWPPQFEEIMNKLDLPSAELDMTVAQYARVVCALLDIPVHDKLTDSLHLLFTLYCDFKNHPQFQH